MCSSSSSACWEMLGFVCWFMASPFGARLRDGFDGIDDRLIAGTAAIVPRKVFADRITARDPATRKQFLRGQQHRRGAETALQRVTLAEGVLQVRDVARIRYALDSLDTCAVALHGEREATAHDFAVQAHRASPADAMLAADMAAGEAERLAQEVDQCGARLDGLRHSLPVHREGDVCWRC